MRHAGAIDLGEHVSRQIVTLVGKQTAIPTIAIRFLERAGIRIKGIMITERSQFYSVEELAVPRTEVRAPGGMRNVMG
jgi:hypothetical protein